MARNIAGRWYPYLAIMGVVTLGLLQGCSQPRPDSAASPAAASTSTQVSPPSGSAIAQECIAPDDGSRAGYHSAQGSTWILDCENPLRREYWRVFLVDGQRAAMIPRPDGAPELQPACANVDHPLHPLVERYALCTPAADATQLMRVNNMLPDDALQIAHFLHTQLRFSTTQAGLGITPYPIPSDILDACALHPQANSPALTALCERERARIQSGDAVGFLYTGPGAGELAQRLNKLYGIQ